MTKRKTTEDFILNSNKIYNNLYDYSEVEYINSHIKVIIKCNTCGNTFKQKPNDHLSGHSCPICANENRRNLQNDNKNIFIEKSNIKHKIGMYDYSEVIYVNSKTSVIIKCNKCGNNFTQLPIYHTQGHGCKCNKLSKMETLTTNILNCLNIKYEKEKTFINCVGKKKLLPFDFYIANCNLLIELDGRQHYNQKNTFYKSKEDFLERQRLDKIKTEYCLQNNINLLRIPYTQLNNIETLLKETLSL